MIKNLKYIFILFVLSACSLDFPVEDQITGFDAIDDVFIANETLSGIYISYPKNKMAFSKLADDFYPNHTIYDNLTDFEFYNWNPYRIQLMSNTLWNDYYATISKANVLLSRFDKIQTESNEVQKLKNIKAETLCLKALCFFDLIQIYAKPYNEATKNDLGIIIKHKIESEKLPRSSLEKSYEETEKLLLEAISNFSDEQKTSYRFSKIGAKTLLAKLYFNWQKYDKAISLCDEIISQKSITATSFEKMWNDLQKDDKDKIVSEIILAMEEKVFYFSEIYDGVQHEDEYYLNQNIVFEDNDVRKKSAIIPQMFRISNDTEIPVNHLGKLRKEIQDIKPK